VHTSAQISSAAEVIVAAGLARGRAAGGRRAADDGSPGPGGAAQRQRGRQAGGRGRADGDGVGDRKHYQGASAGRIPAGPFAPSPLRHLQPVQVQLETLNPTDLARSFNFCSSAALGPRPRCVPAASLMGWSCTP